MKYQERYVVGIARGFDRPEVQRYMNSNGNNKEAKRKVDEMRIWSSARPVQAGLGRASSGHWLLQP
jgi:hypothetical protein